MKQPFNKKRFWLVITLIAVAEALAFCLVMQWKYLFPSREVSELYKRYAEMDGIEASFIKDYRVNDSVTVDVTLLEATTDSAWGELLHDFNMIFIPDEVFEYLNDKDLVVWLAPKTDYSLPMDSVILNNDVISMAYLSKCICVFSIETEQQVKAVNFHQYEESSNKNLNNSLTKNKSNEK